MLLLINERNSFPTQGVTTNLRKHKISTPAQQIQRQKKSGNVPAIIFAGKEETVY